MHSRSNEIMCIIFLSSLNTVLIPSVETSTRDAIAGQRENELDNSSGNRKLDFLI